LSVAYHMSASINTVLYSSKWLYHKIRKTQTSDSEQWPRYSFNSKIKNFLYHMKKWYTYWNTEQYWSPFKKLDSNVDIKKDEQFTHSRKVLEAKRKQLKSQGKGNKKNRLLMLMRPKHCMRNSAINTVLYSSKCIGLILCTISFTDTCSTIYIDVKHVKFRN
jgi:hypothetical protein